MNFRQLIQDYFTFNRNERKGITILLFLIFLLALANKVIFYFEVPGRFDPLLLDSASHELGLYNDSVNRQSITEENFLPVLNPIEPVENKSPDEKTLAPELFKFDPNIATDTEFYRLGLSEKLVATIRKYQGKGGTFRNQDDFFKMRGLNEIQKKAFSGFVDIQFSEASHSKHESVGQQIRMDINSADSIQLRQLPGIGDKLSKRIVKYRDLLGGFYSVTQLREVYGLSEQTVRQIEDQITIDSTKIRKLNVDFSDLKELSKHPYLKMDLARKIVAFRTKNGSIHDLVILKDSMILNIDDYQRLKPYF